MTDDQDSVRLLIAKHDMCDGVDPFCPSSWNEECALGECEACPSPSFPVPPGLEGKLVEMSLWSQREINGKKKFGLWKVVMPIEQLAAELEKEFPTSHVYTSAVCWKKLGDNTDQLRPGVDVILFEDYQKNLDVKFAEMPTSMGYSANTTSLAMIPIVMKFRRPSADGSLTPVETAVIIFMSEDLQHGWQQIEQCEKR